MSEKSIAEVLRQAADLIDKNGHYQGYASLNGIPEERARGYRCALTAIRDISEYRDPNDDAFDYLQNYLGFSNCVQVYDWNDRAAKGVVQRTMRDAADTYEAGF